MSGGFDLVRAGCDRIPAWLRRGGVLLASAPLMAGEQTEPDWLCVPMFFGGIGEDATRCAVEAAGLDIERREVVEEDDGDGRLVSFLWHTARRHRRHRAVPTSHGSRTGW